MAESPGRQTLEHVVLFLLHRAPGERLALATVWKLAYYVDLVHVQQFGRSVTGVTFRKERHGPVPENGVGIVEALSQRQALGVEKVPRFGHYQCVCRAATTPNLQDFEFSERAVLEEVALDWMQATGGQLEAAIRESAPWKAATYGQALALQPGAPTL